MHITSQRPPSPSNQSVSPWRRRHQPRFLSSGLIGITVLLLLSDAGPARSAVENLANDPAQASPQSRRGARGANGVYKARLDPHWLADNTRFWYRNDLRDDRREFILVNAEEGVRGPAFDHDRLAEALRQAGLAEVQADRLPVEQLAFDPARSSVVFRANAVYWRCHLEDYRLERLEDHAAPEEAELTALPASRAPRASTRTGEETEILFVNLTEAAVELFWLDAEGRPRSYGRLGPGEERAQHTFAGHVWRVVNPQGSVLAVFQAEEQLTRAEITGRRPPDRNRSERDPSRPRRGSRDQSPDGKWTAFARDHNVYLRSNADDSEIQLSQDGVEGQAYALWEWAPDAATLVAFRHTPGERKEVYLIESSPEAGGRALLHTRPYELPGDRFDSYELNLFHVANHTQTKPEVDPIDFGRPNLRWHEDGRRFFYSRTDRGHQRFRLMEVDSQTGQTRTLIDETTDTFIWTAHTENVSVQTLNWLRETEELIYTSEKDGWRHLYLFDLKAGQFTGQITQGPYVVRAIDRIDETNRQIWFRASGRDSDQDPYFIHYYRIKFDGSDLVALTEGNGSHSVQYSPDQRFLIDTYSRVDLPPVHELRRVSDGRLICPLEQADIRELEESGWESPEVFVAKGRDGQTDIWGIICRPARFDPNASYPVLEDIYAGPQSSYVPKTFSGARRYASLTDLGFVVVKIDGMGTANRSKAFHDVCWKNLKDAGFPDRILWMQAAARQYPALDLTRVGIYGTSAGGQNAAGAVLFHPEFYKAAVASCGCHDNRMDKASWNEQWMGYPVGPHYAECSNIDNAHRLQGHLMLIVGEMDQNVPPESTLRFADALIKAGKNFDLVVIPGAGHGNGGPYGQRRMEDFFVRHLLGQAPPNHNRPVP